MDNNLEGGGKKWGLYDKFYNISEWLKTIDFMECQHFYENPFRLDKTTFTTEQPTSSDHFSSKSGLIESSLNFSQLQGSMPDVRPIVIRKEEQQLAPLPIRIFSAKKFQIDPFENRKKALLKSRISRKIDSRAGAGANTEYETTEKQTLIDKKDYTQLLHVDKRFHFGMLNKNNNLKAESQTKLAKLVDSKKGYTSAITQTKKIQLESKGALSMTGQNLRKQKSMNDLLLTRMELDLFIF